LLPPADYPFSHWLSVHGQTARALEAFWRPVVVSALNVQPEHASTAQALMLFRDGFLRHRRAYELGLPMVPLSEIAEAARGYLESFGGRVVCRAAAAGIEVQRGAVSGVRLGDGRVVAADAYLSAVPPRALLRLLPESVAAAAPFAGLRHLEYAAIVAAHLWFDRVVTRLDHAALVDRPVDWVFNKSRVNTRVRPYGLEGGTYLTLVVSAAADLVRRPRAEILKLALAEVRDALPEARAAGVVRALVNRHAEATFAPLPGCDRFRPGQVAPIPNLFLAGDWTRTGWPATMEGAVRSGRLAAEAVLAAPGARETLLTPDLAVAPLARVVGRW
ncbi:MAG: FAD-dependent oxidoreductase, partial [Armatimonadetes bacterium]|nr:FAD-dependent oxidoreductase [Armatimonadota bacterium]